jgi:hypothetical protein
MFAIPGADDCRSLQLAGGKNVLGKWKDEFDKRGEFLKKHELFFAN